MHATRPPFSLTKLFCRRGGFTIAEMLVSIMVLTLIVLFVGQLMNGATRITTTGHNRMDSDSQAQQVFDRMAADFNQMIKRTDVSYYFKAATPAMAGNDQMAFFSGVAGHYPQASFNSDASLVAYRVNAISGAASSASYNRLERMGKGLLWNSVSAITPVVFLPLTISGMWPKATQNDSTAIDSDYLLAGPQVFRFEYYYLLNPSGPSGLSGLSPGPWADTGAFRIKDIAAIIVAIGVIDPKSRGLLTKAQIETLAGTNGQTSPFADFTTGWNSGQLLTAWQTALLTDSQIAAMPRPATQNIRFYERYFPLGQ